MKNQLAVISLFAVVASLIILCPLAAAPATTLAPISPFPQAAQFQQPSPFPQAATAPASVSAVSAAQAVTAQAIITQAATAQAAANAVSSPCAVSIPSSGFPGDCIVITFTRIPPIVQISNATVLLLDAKGKAVARAKAFGTATDVTSALLTSGTTLSGSTLAQAKPETKGFPDIVPRIPTLIAVLALPNDLSSGQYRIQIKYLAGIAIIADEKPFRLKARSFPSEEITFDGQNTAIKQDFGTQRIAQIDTLNEILFRQDLDSPRFNGPFVLPVTSKRRTSAFAQSRILHYANGKSEKSVHFGIDFGVPTGTQVHAAGDGLVVMATRRNSTGWTIVIEHNPGIYSLYYHLDKLLVRKGAIVHSGDLIARSGATGLATGPHLHWEFRVNGEAISPDWFVGRKLYESQ